MCGIAGILLAGGDASPSETAEISRMTGTLAHRGPDAQGIWREGPLLFGHTRLSIIDLSDRSCQPMIDDSGRFVMVYNGEVYNYAELRGQLEARGHRFRSEGDSEVVLHAYREWGSGCLDRFNGMWALAIWDRERRELFAARDRAGKKPFYYTVDDAGRFLFASEIKALRAAGVKLGMNPQAVFDFLTQGTYGHLGAHGFATGVLQLPAAHWLLVRPGEPRQVRRYWELPVVNERDRLPYDDAFRARFRDLLTDAVRVRLRADVPVGATLSGGLDSSTLVAIADTLRDGAPLHLFTSLYPGSAHDETPYFDAVVAGLRQPVVHRVTPPAEHWGETLLRVLDHQEEPFGDTSIFAHFHLMEAARSAGVPVILSGQGGDELLLGYPSMVNAYLGHLVKHGQLVRASREVRAWSSGSGIPLRLAAAAAAGHALPRTARDALRARRVAGWAAIVSPSLRQAVSYDRFDDDPRRSTFDSYIAQVFSRFAIPHLTHYDDRNAMAFGVEGRMPFLDHRVVELLFTARYEAVFQEGFTKRVLRESFADVLPPAVRERRDKVGFHTPLGAWLGSQERPLRQFMTRDRMEHVNVLDPRHYMDRLSAFERGAASEALGVWRGYIMHLWADRFGVSPFAEPVGPGVRTERYRGAAVSAFPTGVADE